MGYSVPASPSKLLAFLPQLSFVYFLNLIIVLLPGLGQKPPHQLWGPGFSWMSLPWHSPGHLANSGLVVITADWSMAIQPLPWKILCRSTLVYLKKVMIGLEDDMNSMPRTLVLQISTSEDYVASPQCLTHRKPPSFPHTLNAVFP